jgi:hypothetical protein
MKLTVSYIVYIKVLLDMMLLKMYAFKTNHLPYSSAKKKYFGRF